MNIRNFIIRVIINGLAIGGTAWLLPGIHLSRGGDGQGTTGLIITLLIIGLVFGIINAIIKPILLILTLPAVIITLGLFVLVINALLLLLTAALVPSRLQVDGFGWALIGGVVMMVVAWIVEFVLARIGLAES